LGRGRVLHGQHIDGAKSHVVRVPVVIVFNQSNAVVDAPRVQGPGPVGHDVFRLHPLHLPGARPLFFGLLQGTPVDGEDRVETHELHEEGRRGEQFDLQGFVVHGADGHAVGAVFGLAR